MNTAVAKQIRLGLAAEEAKGNVSKAKSPVTSDRGRQGYGRTQDSSMFFWLWDVVCTQEMILKKALSGSANLNDVGQLDRSHRNQF